MADFAAINEADLETAPDQSEPLTGTGAGALTKGTYEPVNDNDLVPAGGPAGPTGEFAYKGIPAAAAARFKASSAVTNIFGAGVSGFANGYANDFNALADKDKQTLVEGGYGDYKAGFPGSLLQHAADMFNSGLALTVDGFMALGGGISGATGAIEGQIARETGAPEDVAKSAEREGGFVGMAAQSDIGAFHAASLLDAAKANAAVPGVYGHAYRFDVTPEGTAVSTPLGRLPADSAEAGAQAATVADALHLPPSAADVIHRTYVETGRPPAEVLMDAKTNHGGVLSDLVANKVPTVYQGAPRALTPEELAAAKPEVPPPDLSQIPGTIEQAEKLPMAGDNLGGLNVTVNIPNQSSISASLGDDYSAIDGVRAIPMSEFPGAGKGYVSASDISRVKDLAEQIKTNGYIDPLIVVMDKDGPYVLEGGHRLDALKALGQESVPAKVIVDHSNEHPAATAAYDAIEKQRAADQVAFLKEKGMTQAQASVLPAADKKALNTEFQKWRTEKPAPSAPTSQPPPAPTGISKIGKSIDAKAVEAGLTEGFGNTAGYDKITIEDQSRRTADLINTDIDKARAVIRGEEPLPSGMKGTALITAMEDYIKKNPNADLAYELANSPLVTGTSEAAQEMRLAAERTPDSAAAKLAEIKAAQAKAVTPKVVAARRAAIKDALPEAGKVLLPKEELSWNKFLNDIAC